MKEFLFQQYDTISTGWDTNPVSISVNGNNTTQQNFDGTARGGIINMPVNRSLKRRMIYAYIFAKLASDNLSWFECRVSLYDGGDLLVSLPLLYTYKTAGLGNAYRAGAFTWSDAATPIVVPESLPVKLGSPFAQLQNPPADETSGLIYLHPFPVNYQISKIQVDIVRWTNININGPGRVILGTKAE